MLDNVFESKDIINYIFSIDYIYNFLQIKLICNDQSKMLKKEDLIINKNNFHHGQNNIKNKDEKEINSISLGDKNSFFFDNELRNLFKSEENSISLVKLGIDFKKKQKLDCYIIDNIPENDICGKNRFELKNNDYLGKTNSKYQTRNKRFKSKKKFNKFTNPSRKEEFKNKVGFNSFDTNSQNNSIIYKSETFKEIYSSTLYNHILDDKKKAENNANSPSLVHISDDYNKNILTFPDAINLVNNGSRSHSYEKLKNDSTKIYSNKENSPYNECVKNDDSNTTNTLDYTSKYIF